MLIPSRTPTAFNMGGITFLMTDLEPGNKNSLLIMNGYYKTSKRRLCRFPKTRAKIVLERAKFDVQGVTDKECVQGRLSLSLSRFSNTTQVF